MNVNRKNRYGGLGIKLHILFDICVQIRRNLLVCVNNKGVWGRSPRKIFDICASAVVSSNLMTEYIYTLFYFPLNLPFYFLFSYIKLSLLFCTCFPSLALSFSSIVSVPLVYSLSFFFDLRICQSLHILAPIPFPFSPLL